MTISNTGVTNIAADAVGSAEIAADAVGSSEIAANAVGSSEIATDAVDSAEIAAGAVGVSEAPGFVNSDLETLKVIRGTYTTNSPTILTGSDYTLSRNSSGDVTVFFTADFSAAPAVTASCLVAGAGVSMQGAPGTGNVRLQSFNTTTGAAVENTVSFIAIGPR